MTTTTDAAWIQKRLSSRCPQLTITTHVDAAGNILITGTSPAGTFTESSADHVDEILADVREPYREQLYRAVRSYFDDLDADTAAATLKAEAPTLPYPTLPLGPVEPSAIVSPEIGADDVYVGCGADTCTTGWDVSHLTATGHLWDPSTATPADEDESAGYTVCNQCGRVYPNANRNDGGPMPTIARVDVSTDVWLDAIDLYNHRTFATELTRPANQEQR
ncbi:hypothetical protein ACI2IX_20005 [Leifsonia aquatica]|uniref:hypothetical protein n=1 Tax=Leifsonia aquatica TaxID=144185 RepID=UPI00384F1526